MSLANNDPEMFDKLTKEETDMPQEINTAIEIPVRVMTEVDRYSASKRLKESLMMELKALPAYIFLKQAEAIIGDAITLTKEDAMSGVDGKSGEEMGAKWEIKGVRKYEYDDPTLSAYEAEAKALSEKIKTRKRFLESLPNDMADAETGEIAKKAKKVADGINIAITLPK